MNDSDFDDMLRTARGEIPLPDSFRRGVWQRIGSEEASSAGQCSWWRSAITALVRPWTAAAGLAATIALGLWLGASSVPNREGAEEIYAASISPFAQTHRK